MERFDDIRSRREEVKVFAKWRVFQETETDWAPIDSLREDVPVMLQIS